MTATSMASVPVAGSPEATLTAAPAGWLATARTQFAQAGTLGLIPQVVLVAALGLVAIALADTAGRLGWPGGQVLFWLGYVALVMPFVLRLLSRAPERGERLALVVLLGLGLYMVKVLYAPASFVMFDEFLHWKTLDDIVSTGRLFTHNNILPASPFYPGLEIATEPLVKAGLQTWDSAILVIGAARVLTALTMFLLVERVSGSARLGGVTTLIYMANPSFLFFDSQFGYESLAVPLAMFVIYCVLRRERGSEGRAVPLTLALLIALGAEVVTHHVTSFLLAIFLTAWVVVSLLIRRLRRAPEEGQRPDSPGLLGPALISIVAAIAWMLNIASVTVGYLAPAFGGALDQLVNIIAGEESGRELFRAASGGAAPAWEQLLGYGSVLLLLVGLLIGGVVLWRTGRRNVAAVTLGLVGLAYPATLAGRFTALGAELSARSAAFVFIGLAFVTATAAIALVNSDRLRGPGRALVASAIGIVFAGAVVVGFPYWARLPGPYLVSADPRSIGPEGIDTATWMLSHLGPENRLMTDRDNRVLAASYGQQRAISAIGDRVDVKAAYFATSVTPDTLAILRDADVQFVLADERLPTSLPYSGVYVERGEIASGEWATPMPAAALDKWDTTPKVDRIYDSGDLRLYNIERLVNGSR